MEPLKRIQLNDDGSMQPTLQGGVQAFQDAVDTSQGNIDALPNTGIQGFLKGTAQVPQDFFNVIAHPAKTAQESYEYYKNNPKMLLPLNQLFEYQNQQNQAIMNRTYNPEKELGSLTGGILMGVSLGGLGKGRLNTPKGYTTASLSEFLDNPKPNIPTVKPKTLKVYHGSGNPELSYLDTKYSGQNTPAVALNTVSVSENPSYAKNYALQNGRDGYLYQGEIIPSNFIEDSVPINKQLKQQSLLNIANEYGINPNIKGVDFFNYLQENYNPTKHGNIPINEYLRRQGIDGVHFRNQMEYATTQNLPVQKILDVPYTEKNIYEIP